MKYTWLFLLTLWLPMTFAQDVYQVLRDDVRGFAKVKRGVPLVFPEDHFPHPDYRIEWWYITANLRDQQGQDWGVQWTLFRQSLSPEADTEGWDSNQLWMAHAAITTPEQHMFEQRFARGGIGQADVSKFNVDKFNVNKSGASQSGGFDAWIDDWRWQSSSNTLFPSTLEFSVGEHKVSLELNGSDNWVLNGDAGFSQKSLQGQASYYYSQPNIVLNGTIKTNRKTVTLSGDAWLDREWSSQALAQNQKGWDWFSLHLDDGSKLMVYQLRHEPGDELIDGSWLSGSWISPKGEMIPLNKGDIELSPLSQRQITTKNNAIITLPLDWSIKLLKLGRSLTIKPLYDEQWLATSFPYWEGVVLVGDDKGQTLGKGYMELTGYQAEY